MFEHIQRLYRAGQLTEAGVREAARRGWISQEQAEQVLNGRAAHA